MARPRSSPARTRRTAAVMPLLFQERLGITEHTIGYVIMYFAGLGVVVRAGILGRMVDWLGEPKLARLGAVLLAAGLVIAAFGRSWPVLFTSFTLMPFGTAFLFPSVTGLLSQIVWSRPFLTLARVRARLGPQ